MAERWASSRPAWCWFVSEAGRGESMDKAKLIDLMADKGLTQAELAKAAHISKTAVYGLMNGRKPRTDTLGKIAKALGVKPSELLDM
nr:helix-turn-helix transcriptional regulator [Mitsuokella multacida]